jgi:hypothetical protein
MGILPDQTDGAFEIARDELHDHWTAAWRLRACGGMEMEHEVGLKFRILYYPFMGTSVNTERLLVLARLCYRPIGVDELYDMVWGGDGKPSDSSAKTMDDEAVGKFVRGLIRSGHLGALEHWNTSFAVEGYSRISSQQNDRHRLMKMFKDPSVPQAGCHQRSGKSEECQEIWINGPEQASADTSQMQQSQRYVREDDFRYVVFQFFQRCAVVDHEGAHKCQCSKYYSSHALEGFLGLKLKREEDGEPYNKQHNQSDCLLY